MLDARPLLKCMHNISDLFTNLVVYLYQAHLPIVCGATRVYNTRTYIHTTAAASAAATK